MPRIYRGGLGFAGNGRDAWVTRRRAGGGALAGGGSRRVYGEGGKTAVSTTARASRPLSRGVLALVALAACSRDPEPQGGGPEPDAEVSPPVLPTLSVSAPERGAFVPEGSLQVAGSAVAGDAALSTLTLNGAEVALDGGGQPGSRATFATTLATEPGINILGFRVDDAAGERAIDGRAVYAGPLLDPGATVEGGMRMQIGPELLDDDDSDLDDVAAIVEVVLGDPAIASAMVGTPFESDYFVLTPTSLSWTGASVDIVPGDAGLAVNLTLTDLWMDFDVEGTGWYDWLGTSGSAWADAVTIRTTLVATSGGGGITVTPRRGSTHPSLETSCHIPTPAVYPWCGRCAPMFRSIRLVRGRACC